MQIYWLSWVHAVHFILCLLVHHLHRMSLQYACLLKPESPIDSQTEEVCFVVNYRLTSPLPPACSLPVRASSQSNVASFLYSLSLFNLMHLLCISSCPLLRKQPGSSCVPVSCRGFLAPRRPDSVIHYLSCPLFYLLWKIKEHLVQQIFTNGILSKGLYIWHLN